MGNPMKIRATANGDLTEIKVLMRHDMETGLRREGGVLVPAWHIQEVSVKVNGKLALQAEWGPAISKDPFLSLKVKGAAKGDSVSVTWVDNKGDSRSDETKVV